MKDLNISILGDIYGNLLTEKQKNILRDYFDCDLSLSEIAQQYGVTRQAVADTVKTGEKILIKYEEELGFGEKLSKIRTIAEQISKQLDCGNYSEAKEETAKLLNELW